MIRRTTSFAVVTAALAFVLAACGTEPGLSDPREIVIQGVEATNEVSSFHLEIAVDGTISAPEMGGGEISLNGTTIEGDFDFDGPSVQVAVAVPAMLGLTADAIVVGGDMYVRTSLGGELWSHSEVSEGDPVGDMADVQGALQTLIDFLEREAVGVEKLDDVDCGDRTCYHVRLTIPASELVPGEDGLDLPVEDVFGDGLELDLLFDREDGYLVEVATDITAEPTGSLSLTVSLSGFGEDVDIQAPPADQVTEGGGFGF